MTKDEMKQIRDALKAKGVSVGGRTSAEKLIELAEEHGISVKKRASIVPSEYKEQYGAEGNCGDELAALLKEYLTEGDGIDQNRMTKLAHANGVDMGRWSHLNVGQQRMNLGNVLRGRLKRGEQVVVGDKTFNKGQVPEKKAKKAKKAA